MDKSALIVFPFAGGNSNSFRGLEKSFSDSLNIEFNCIEYPGRGRRIGEKLITNLDELIDDIYQKYEYLFEGKYYFLGYSMGGLVAQLMIKKLIAKEKILPISNFVMACRSPRHIAENSIQISQLQDNEFIQRILAFGGVDEQISNEKGLLDFFIPIIRADYIAYENYKFIECNPTYIPIYVFGGNEDEIKKSDLLDWKEETKSKFELMMCNGGHFFLFNDTNLVLEKLKTIISN